MIAEDFCDVVSCFHKHNVEYLIVGAFAMAHFGYRRSTGAIDIFVRPTTDNSILIHHALSDFGAPLSEHGVSPDFFAREGNFYQIGLPPNRIDFLTQIDGVTFAEAKAQAAQGSFAGTNVLLLSLEHLIKNKRATGRAKDVVDANELERLIAQRGVK